MYGHSHTQSGNSNSSTFKIAEVHTDGIQISFETDETIAHIGRKRLPKNSSQ